MIKKYLVGLMVVACLSSLNIASAARESLDSTIAVVNEAVITQSELDHAIANIKKHSASEHLSLPPEEVLRKQVLDQLINHKLQLQIAEQTGIHVSDAELNEAVEKIAKNNKMTMQQFYNELRKDNTSYADFRQQLREEIAIQQLQQREVGGQINISPQELSDFMHSSAWQNFNNKEYHLQDILISLPEAPTSQQIAAANEQAKTLLTKIQHGMNFREAAMAESKGSKALQGGDLGWRQLPEIPTAFAAQVVHMKVNDTAGPIRSANGFHLIRLVDVRDTKNPGHAGQLQERQIEQLLYQRKFEEALQTWLTRIRSDAYIKIQ